MNLKDSMVTGGACVVNELLNQQTQLIFCVPGESYLGVLDACFDARDNLKIVSCRHESGAAFMAVAHARLTGKAGVCFLSRGPGACNASIALHVARQSSIPLVVGIGQVRKHNLGREAFQEIDYNDFYRGVTKEVLEVEAVEDLGVTMRHAFAAAESGRPGPVAVVMPEDILLEQTNFVPPMPGSKVIASPSQDKLQIIGRCLADSERPLIIVGGSVWKDEECRALQIFAAKNDVPVLASFRRQDIFDNNHPCYGGYLGYGTHENVWSLAEEADCVLIFGARMDEPTTRDYQLFSDGKARQFLLIHPDPDEVKLVYDLDFKIAAMPGAVAGQLSSLGHVSKRDTRSWRALIRNGYTNATLPPQLDSKLDPLLVIEELNSSLDPDAFFTIDAGNFTRWPMRGRRYSRARRLLGPVNGAMGYGVPAAVAASILFPKKQVVCCVGDGGMLMTGGELATAKKYGANPKIVVFNNGVYGTIQMHQDKAFPERRIATSLHNPGFVEYAASFGIPGIRLRNNGEVKAGVKATLNAESAFLLELEFDGY